MSSLSSCKPVPPAKRPPAPGSEREALIVRHAGACGKVYTTPKASIASATFLKPAIFAPFT